MTFNLQQLTIGVKYKPVYYYLFLSYKIKQFKEYLKSRTKENSIVCKLSLLYFIQFFRTVNK